MNATELRIGNFVEVENYKIIQLENIHSKGTTKGDEQYLISMLKPIPLTEEWLLKFGFSNRINDWRKSEASAWAKIDKSGVNILGLSQHKEYGSNKHLSFYFNIGGSYTLSSIDQEIKNVHQLQNLFFALTGDELTIKNE